MVREKSGENKKKIKVKGKSGHFVKGKGKCKKFVIVNESLL